MTSRQLRNTDGTVTFEGLNDNIFKTYFYPRYSLMYTFQPNLNHSILIWNEKVRTKTLTRCLAGSWGTELGQSVFESLNDHILKISFYGIFPYKYSLQENLNHSCSILYEEVMTKIRTVYHKSSLLKLYFSGCSLEYLTYQLFFY